MLATVSGRVAAELIVGFSDGASLIDGGHDLDSYLFPVAQRLGPERIAAIFGRSPRAVFTSGGTAQPDTAEPPRSSRPGWLGLSAESGNKSSTIGFGAGGHHRSGPGRAEIALTTGPGRNWASFWKRLIDAFGPCWRSPTAPFHPHDDRIVSLGLHHTIDTSIAHDMIIDASWTSL